MLIASFATAVWRRLLAPKFENVLFQTLLVGEFLSKLALHGFSFKYRSRFQNLVYNNNNNNKQVRFLLPEWGAKKKTNGASKVDKLALGFLAFCPMPCDLFCQKR